MVPDVLEQSICGKKTGQEGSAPGFITHRRRVNERRHEALDQLHTTAQLARGLLHLRGDCEMRPISCSGSARVFKQDLSMHSILSSSSMSLVPTTSPSSLISSDCASISSARHTPGSSLFSTSVVSQRAETTVRSLHRPLLPTRTSPSRRSSRLENGACEGDAEFESICGPGERTSDQHCSLLHKARLAGFAIMIDTLTLNCRFVWTPFPADDDWQRVVPKGLVFAMPEDAASAMLHLAADYSISN